MTDNIFLRANEDEVFQIDSYRCQLHCKLTAAPEEEWRRKFRQSFRFQSLHNQDFIDARVEEDEIIVTYFNKTHSDQIRNQIQTAINAGR